MFGITETQPGVIFNDDTMTRERLERKYSRRTEVWKQDVMKMADYYEKIIAGLQNQLNWAKTELNLHKKIY